MPAVIDLVPITTLQVLGITRDGADVHGPVCSVQATGVEFTEGVK